MSSDVPNVVSRWASHAVEFSPDGVLVVSKDGTIVYDNAAARALAGCDGTLVGSNVDALVPSGVRGHHHRLRNSYFSAPSTRPMGSGLELSLERLDGVEVPVEIALSPFDDDDDTYVVATVRDVTERRRDAKRLVAATQQLALLDERERIGRDLHDVVLQRLYGTGLTVQAIGAGADPSTSAGLDSVIDEIDRVITEVRTIVFTLGNSAHRGALGQDLADVVAQANRVLGFTPTLRLNGPVESVLSDEMSVEMVASMREALGNVARHADAGKADVTVAVDGDRVVMRVVDDGVGPPEHLGRPTGGNGLINMQARAAALGGECTLTPGDGAGAVLTWSVPY
ncbi:MAG: PAS domain S-box protein [Ilumatobacteraceae bacterium]|nr:PAS domain S-box protein [Ilumatobacteraceae bacterium]